MILTPGEIYFLGEKDLKTGENSPFVKIGLVRENESRGTADRLKDHQTGNPRLLHIVKIVKTPLVIFELLSLKSYPILFCIVVKHPLVCHPEITVGK